MVSEYNNIDVIGSTFETASNAATKKIRSFYHNQQVKTVNYIIKKMGLKDFGRIIDLGCANGGWYDDYKNMLFKKIIGIDISEERANKAKQRGYNETHVCNAYNLPFGNQSEICIISNGVLVHVLQDTHKLKIFKEVKRVLKKKGIFIFSISNA